MGYGSKSSLVMGQKGCVNLPDVRCDRDKTGFRSRGKKSWIGIVSFGQVYYYTNTNLFKNIAYGLIYPFLSKVTSYN